MVQERINRLPMPQWPRLNCANEGGCEKDGAKECEMKECDVANVDVRCRMEESGGEEDDFASARRGLPSNCR